MYYTLGTAAKATGKSKPTIHRAIKSGKISAEKSANGDWHIQPAELHRVFSPVTEEAVTSSSYDVIGKTEKVTHIIALQEKLDVTLQRVTEKEEQLRHQEEQIRDARNERDHWRQQATYLLEDKGKKENILEQQRETQRTLSEDLIRKEAEKEQLEKSLQDTQAKLAQVKGSWLGRLLFKV